VIHPDGSRESLVWNERGQLTGWRDPLESEVSWAYNALGLPVSLTDRIGRVRQWRYDPRGNLLRLDNGNGAEYRFTYDAVGRPLSETRPDETVRHMEWDARGFSARSKKTAGLPPTAASPVASSSSAMTTAGC
jgi:YD repeat-containing protein